MGPYPVTRSLRNQGGLSDLAKVELAEVSADGIPGKPLDLPDCGYQVMDDARDLAEDSPYAMDGNHTATIPAEIECDGHGDAEVTFYPNVLFARDRQGTPAEYLLVSCQFLVRFGEQLGLDTNQGGGLLFHSRRSQRHTGACHMNYTVLIDQREPV